MPLIDKKTLRSECLARRTALTAEFVLEASQAIGGFLAQLLPAQPTVIACYHAVRGEVALAAFMSNAQALGHILCLPVIESPEQPLFFREFHPALPLAEGKHNIAVPSEHAALLLPDMVLVPLLAYDKHGHRLGYGAGYYDRTIAQLRRDKKGVVIVGVAYTVQEVAALPAEAHDQRLDAVVTEKGIMSIV